MKPLFVLFGTLAIVCAALAAPADRIGNKEEYVAKINEIRRQYAKDHKITNMYKLEWDNYLEKKAKANNYDGEKKTCRVCLRDGNQDQVKQAKDMLESYFGDSNVKKVVEMYKDYHMNGWEELTPHQKKIGCAPHYTEPQKIGNFTIDFNTLCFMEPEGTGESWTFKRDKAGTACAEGYKNDDGLCAPIAKSSSSSDAGNSSKDKSSNTPNPEGVTESNGNSYESCLLTIVIAFMLVIS